MKTVLITGGAGFIGTNLIHYLIDTHKIICVDNFISGSEENIQCFYGHQNFTFIKHNIIEPLEIETKIDQIYNLACPASPPFYQGKNALFTTKTCILGMINMLELANKHNATVLQASTSEVYGDPLEHPQKETYFGNVNPNGIRSCYDEGKRAAESLCFTYKSIFNTKIKIVRIFNTYGEYMDIDDGRVISNFICQALQNKDVTLYGDGSQTRSFCYIQELLDILVKVMNSEEEITGPINIGNPSEFSIKELAETVLAKLPQSSSKIIYKPLPKDDPTQRQPDISLAKKLFHWEPHITLSEGLDKTIMYFEKKLNAINV